ncbi:hypothetical protein [Bradyrhizobium sp. NP1]|uniref:hypothetical protein n=1 Tax=Bradyrhizobium sp. NP1 TaxID=3049772 RepID=UPI0025A59EA1|nr:hypothetical protein [Bradyrhizobium sp. NP1]WJR74936.1 hypothetical protein QOU61_19095 [Bradyrhizobium sp. NP1]
MKDAFDQWWEWANKPLDSDLTIPSDLHFVMTSLVPEDDWHSRERVNEAVRQYRQTRR